MSTYGEITGGEFEKVLIAFGYTKRNNKGSHHLWINEGMEGINGTITVRFIGKGGNVSRDAMRDLSRALEISIHDVYKIATNKKELKKLLKNKD